ncbi:MAG TPA: hypothetical protein VK889_04045 [Solirubrobacterales bacterium]|nr:hypothetical protein [Solirubrobacterales bacterium]
MNPLGRIGIFVAGLVLVFGAAVGVGSLVEPADTEDGGHGGGGHGAAAHTAAGYSLDLDSTSFARGEPAELSFSVLADGEPVAGFDELHERRMHLIVVRRDGRGFQHLHPEMDEEGTWLVPIEFGEAGEYRAFADFSVGGEQRTLSRDLSVSGGAFRPRPFPAPRPLASAGGGYEVRLDAGDPVAGESSSLGFSVGRNGEPVGDLDPYLGARGHLVALREGDLAFLHVHPEAAEGHGHGGQPEGAAHGEIAFGATFPSAGRYRLYLQFRHEGVVRTAAFTVEVPR